MKKPKYNFGGVVKSLLPALDLVAPGLGTASSALVGLIDQPKPIVTPNRTSNPFRQYAKGGKLKIYNAPTHAQGGQAINKMGNPDAQNEIGEIEKRETALTGKAGEAPYIFSDRLTNKDGKTFAELSKMIERKFGNKNDSINKGTYKKLMADLMEQNDEAREMANNQPDADNMKYPNGGQMPFQLMPNQLDAPNLSTTPLNNFGRLQAKGVSSLTATKPSVGNVLPSVTATKSGLPNMNAGSLLKTAAYIGTGIDAFQKQEKEQLRLPDYGKGNKDFAGLGASYEPMRAENQMAADSASNVARESVGNYGQLFSRINAIQSAAGKNQALSQLQQKQYNDQIAMARGQRADNIAQGNAQELIRTQNANSQNRAMSQDAKASFLENINNLGTELEKQNYLKEATKQMNVEQKRKFFAELALINTKNSNFQIDEKLLGSNNPTSAIKFKI